MRSAIHLSRDPIEGGSGIDGSLPPAASEPAGMKLTGSWEQFLASPEEVRALASKSPTGRIFAYTNYHALSSDGLFNQTVDAHNLGIEDALKPSHVLKFDRVGPTALASMLGLISRSGFRIIEIDPGTGRIERVFKQKACGTSEMVVSYEPLPDTAVY